MLHDDAEQGRLQHRPVLLVGLGDRHEIRAEEDALDALDLEQALGQRRTRGTFGEAKSTLPDSTTARPGRNFRVAGLGVSSVWMNMDCSTKLLIAIYVSKMGDAG